MVLPLLFVAACVASGRPSLEDELAAAPDDAARGRVLYEHSCQRCHALFMPASFDAHEWPFLVRRYGRRARLDDGQQALVLRYLQANARPE
jgi:cytochrome c5